MLSKKLRRLTLNSSKPGTMFLRDVFRGANAELANLAETERFTRSRRGALCRIPPVIASRVGVNDSRSQNNLNFVALFGKLADDDFL